MDIKNINSSLYVMQGQIQKTNNLKTIRKDDISLSKRVKIWDTKRIVGDFLNPKETGTQPDVKQTQLTKRGITQISSWRQNPPPLFLFQNLFPHNDPSFLSNECHLFTFITYWQPTMKSFEHANIWLHGDITNFLWLLGAFYLR